MNHLKESAKTKENQKENIKGEKALILNFFKQNQDKSFTTKEVIAQSGASHDNCGKRIAELIREGLIMSVGKSGSGKSVMNRWLLSSPQHIEQLKRRQLETDYKNWIKQGERFKDLIK